MRVISICGLIVFLLTACSDGGGIAERRAKKARTAKEDIIIGVVVPWQDGRGDLWRGIALAVKEINTKGIRGRKLQIVREDDQSLLDRGRTIAQKFAEDPDMVAVVGHANSYISVPASSIYQNAGLVMITPIATSSSITEQDFDLVFRSCPGDNYYGEALADYAFRQGYKRIVIAYVKEKSSRQQVNSFELRARELGIRVVDRRPFHNGAKNFLIELENWKDFYDFDAIFVSMYSLEGGRFISQARKKGVTVPIFGGDKMANSDLWQIAGVAAEGVAVPAGYSPIHPAAKRFSSEYYSLYGETPTDHSAKGYDSVHLLANAIRQAGTTVPADIAESLRMTKNWQGVTSGDYTFNAHGAASGMKIDFMVMKNGKFEFLKDAMGNH